ncbi:MAG: RsmB/NOP family class I SAM-dependent RNA methyltransferase [Sulfuricellaceae bacterium]|nr:RsmB/NOP family class I SAM-dependent RNA methyltransferase [Sulfuricellaceae bacterium]
MNPITQPRLGHIVHVLAAILPFREPADVALSRYFRQHHELGSRDREFVAETVFAALRRYRLLRHWAPDGTPRQLALIALTKISGFGVRELEAVLQEGEADWLRQLKAGGGEEYSLAVLADFPDWLVEKLRTFLSDADILTLGRAMQQPAPLDLRVNTLLANRDEVLQILQAEGVTAEATPFSPMGIRLAKKIALNKHPIFIEGKVEVQDEGSQLLGILLAPKRRDMVVDFCAGAGGKTLLLGALMHSQGRLYAYDVSDKRLAKLKPRLKRSGLSNVHPQLIVNENDIKVKRLAGKIDRVLVDAPCSGLGTLRRNPDLKWRQTPESVAELRVMQAAILAGAARLPKAGGRLVYATCSLLPEENEEVVEAFLAAHPDYRLIDCSDILKQQRIPLDTGKYLKLLPQVHGTDAFFAAVLEKTATDA